LSINVRWWNAEAAYALNIARGLRLRGDAVWMIVNPGSPVHWKAMALKIPVVTDIDLDSRSPFRHWRNLQSLLALIDRFQIEVINSFKSNGAFLFSLAHRLRPGLVYIKTRGEARPPRRHVLNRYLYGTSGCDGVITAGNRVREWLLPLGLSDQRIKTIYYGDTPLRPDPPGDASVVRRRLNIPENVLVMTLLGRTQRVKGHRVLLEALTDLQRPSLHLLLLIKDPKEFPEELLEIQRFIDDHNLRSQVTLSGFQPNLAEVLAVVDLGVIPSLDSEINCRVAVEFFSLGLPVLAFPTGTLPDLIEHPITGYLCPEKSREALARGIDWMLADRKRLTEIGRRGNDAYREKFALEKMAEETSRFYDDCLATRPKKGMNDE
jgi:glycosyltransferase involved in cell wall biosynthesis